VSITLLMKWKMLQAIIHHHALKPSAGVVAARLLDHLNSTSLRCNPSYATIAEATGISRDTVMSSVQDIEVAGYLIVDRLLEPGEKAAKGQRLPSNSFKFDWSKIDQSEKPTTPRRKNRPPQSEKPTTPVNNSDHPQSENTGEGSRNLPPKAGKEETGNLETGNRTNPAVAGQLALLDQTSSGVASEKRNEHNDGKRRRKAKSELPEDWVFSDQQWAFGANLGLTGDQIETAQRKLKRWVKREGKRYVDWNSFAEDWLEREIAFLKNSARGGATADDLTGFSDFANGADHGR
jgi:hypothetical protein